jgi:polysaccharide biosynthesis transport protein
LSPSESHDALTPQLVLRTLWRRKLVCLAVAVIVLIGGGAFAVTRPRLYESTSSVAFLPVPTNASVLPNYPNLIASLIPTYVQLVSSPILLNRVAATLPFYISGSELASEVHAEELSSAAVINIVGQSPNPAQAQEIAAAVTSAFLAQVRGNGVVVTQIYGRPTVPSQPSSPKTKLLLGVILVLAICLGLAAGLIWDRLAGRPEEGDQPAEAASRPPVLGAVHDPGQGNLVSSIQAGTEAVANDGWQSLRTNFMYAMLGQQMQSVTVMSPGPDPASATVAVKLAAATVAELGIAVVLVDADVRHPALHEAVGLDNRRGLTTAALKGVDPATLVRPVPGMAGLQVITGGPPLPAQHDAASLYREQLPRLTSLADLVIVAAPPASDSTGAGVVAGVTDGVVLVLRAKALTWKRAEAAVADIRSAGARVLGTVLIGMGGPAGTAGGTETSRAYEASQPTT